MPATIAAFLMPGSSPNFSALVERASSVYRWIAIGYIASLLLAALFSYLLWAAGNKVQDALSADADSRISKVKADAADAQRVADDKIRQSDEKIAELNKQSEALKVEAEHAREQIEVGHAAAALANAEAARAKAEAAKANERAGALELETEKQREKTANAELALAELQERMRPRHLTAFQVKAIVEALRRVPSPKGGVAVFAVSNSPEAEALAIEFGEVFERGGWKVVSHGEGTYFPAPVGILISSRVPLFEAEYALKALQAVGMSPVSLGLDGTAPENGIGLLVGAKQ